MNVSLVEKEKLAKSPLEMHYLGDKVLRQPAKRVAKVDDSIRELVKQMLQTMYSENGIGLAAPQIGIHKQIIVIDCQPDNPNTPALVLINPEIKKSSKDLCVMEEGCLSIPNVFLDVVRPRSIDVVYKDEFGKQKKMKAMGLLSRVIQHEMDHLNGVLFVDRVQNKFALTEELNKKGFSVSAVQSIS
ncbi:peptide deformylase [Geminocystis sp. CENA526]|uniref:peptide deformylase n=1 Tax=Geminocystis sp. CENA526 TaxID=1355871 RepID=UPI003D6F61F0